MHKALVHTCPILVKCAIKDFIECKNLFKLVFFFFFVIPSAYHGKINEKNWRRFVKINNGGNNTLGKVSSKLQSY
jgi:hypothetical protein